MPRMPRILTDIFQFTECPKQAPDKRRKGGRLSNNFKKENEKCGAKTLPHLLLVATTTCSDVKLFERGPAAPFDFYLGLFLGHDLGTKA